MIDKIRFEIYLNNKIFTIPSKFKGLTDVSDDIYSQLFLSPSHKYYVKTNAKEDVFSSFLNYWVYQKEPQITFENYYEYHQLSQEFGIMHELLEQSKANFDECEQNLYILKYSSDSDTSSIEHKVSENLDDYIEKHSDKLMTLKIQTLVNIFNYDKRKLTKQNEAYKFIKKHYEENQNDSIFVLCRFIEGKFLNKENLKDAISEGKNRLGFLPNIEFSFFDKIASDIKKSNHENDTQNAKIDELEKVVKKQAEMINEIQKKNDQKIEELKKQQKQQITEIQSRCSIEIEKQNKTINDLVKQINEMKKIEEERRKLFDKLTNDHKSDVAALNSKITEINGKLSEQKTDLSKQKQEITKNNEYKNEQQKLYQQINLKIDNIETKMEHELKTTNEKVEKVGIKSIPYIKNNEFKGIINYFKETSRNIYDVINISSSSIYNNIAEYSPQNVIKYDDPEVEFCSKNISGSWIQFEFKWHQIIPKNYTIRSYNNGKNSYHPRSWNIEGSNEGDKWDVLDSEKDCDFLNGDNLVHTFDIKNKNNQKYKFLRMIATGSNWANFYYLNINCIEFYGFCK